MTGGVGFAGDGAGRGRNNRRMMDERRKRNFKNAGRREDYGDSEAIYSKEEAIEKRKDYLKMKEGKQQTGRILLFILVLITLALLFIFV